jgi:hypothetical protein
MKYFADFKARVHRLLINANAPVRELVERQLILQAQAMTAASQAQQRLAGLHAAEFKAFSQWGEDGIINRLTSQLPEISHSFVEFGVEDYRESNTRLLLQLRNWRGLVIDGSDDHIANIRSQDIYWRYDLKAESAFVDRGNINALIADAGFDGALGLLSIDIDGNDFWVWQAIDVVSPAIVVAEYNAVLGDRYALTIPYCADFQRTRAHHSNLYFGASIRALIGLAGEKGYTFVGTTSTGCNAFFVRDDLASMVLDTLECVWAFPSRVRESRNVEGHLTYVSGAARKNVIDTLPFINIETGKETTLAACPDLYSTAWLAGQGAQWETSGATRVKQKLP